MAKKAELLEQAKKLKLEVSAKNTISEIEAAIGGAASGKRQAVSKEGVAKAGKRSEKALKEADAKQEKEERKAKADTSPASAEAEAKVKKGPKPVARPRIERRGKKYQAKAKLIETGKQYQLKEAVELAAKTSPSTFDASVEVHVRLNVDPRQADQNIRSTVSLPHGSGKTVRVAVFAPEEAHAAAKKAGADITGDDDLLKKLDKEEIDFDVLITQPQLMQRLAKYARVLGPRGLMPNPKSGTVNDDLNKAVTEAKAGKVEYRVDKQGIIHLSIGKISFGADKLQANADVFFENLHTTKPGSIKGIFVKSISMSASQGPGISVTLPK